MMSRTETGLKCEQKKICRRSGFIKLLYRVATTHTTSYGVLDVRPYPLLPERISALNSMQATPNPLRTPLPSSTRGKRRPPPTVPAMQEHTVKKNQTDGHLNPTSPPPSNLCLSLSLSFLFANRLFNAPSHRARFSSSGAQKRKLLSSAIICIQYALFLEMGSISTALMIDNNGMRRMAEYSCVDTLVCVG